MPQIRRGRFIAAAMDAYCRVPLLLGLACFLLVLVLPSCSARSRWGEGLEWVDQDGFPSNINSSSWICRMNEDYNQGWLLKITLARLSFLWRFHCDSLLPGPGGVVDKSLCQASCNASHSKEYLGYLGAVVAVLFFGSNLVPVKRYETGDGKWDRW